MSDHNKRTKRGKVGKQQKYKKPYPGFPLFPHSTGRWCKTINRRSYYFGKIEDDPDGTQALERLNRELPYLKEGRTPPADDGKEYLTVALLLDKFLNAKRRLLDSGEISSRTWKDYHKSCGKIVRQFGKHRRIDDLTPEDFERLRASFAKGLQGPKSPASIAHDVRRTRILFKFAYDASLIDRPIRFGPHFKCPSKKVMREARHASGVRMLQADELRKLLDNSKLPIRAMILLAINGGLGQTDIANLPKSAIDFENGFLDYPRPKTAIQRRIPLWPETVEAIRDAIKRRPDPQDPADETCVFLTQRGNRWVRQTNAERKAFTDAVGLQFGKLLRRLKLKRRGLNFYCLRHSFRTIADEVRDPPAIDRIMGHADESMAERYRERIGDDRLQTVTEHVRNWLWEGKLEGNNV